MRRPEDALHIWTADLLKQCGHKNVLALHIPNQGRRSIQWAMKLKRMGLLAGSPDWLFVLPPSGTAAFLELKAPKGRQSDTQEAFEGRAVSAGARYELARSQDEVVGILKGWNVIKGGIA